jgi:EpsI family protein
MHARSGFLIVLLTIAAGLAAIWPAVLSYLEYWHGTEMLSGSHGYVMAAISGWLIWRARHDVEQACAAPSWPFVILTALLGFVWYLAWISATETGTEMLFPLILLSGVAGAVGLRAARAVGFGVGFLVFANPIWSHLNVPLQSLSSSGVSMLTGATGLPAFVDGNTVRIPSGAIEIGGGCSGLNYLIVALAIAALYGELNRDRLRHRILLLAIAAALAIVMNWVRIYGIVLNAQMTDMKGYLVTVEHLRFGWALFAVLLVAFFWVARRLVPPRTPLAQEIPQVTGRQGHTRLAFVGVLAGLGIAPLLTAVAGQLTPDAADIRLKLPSGSGGWLGPSKVVGGWAPAYPGADAAAIGQYESRGLTVTAYVNAYTHQAQGHEIIGFGSSVLGSDGWQNIGGRPVSARASHGMISYEQVEAIAPGPERWVIGYVYAIGGRPFVGSFASKMYYGLAVLQGRPWSGVVAAASRCGIDCAGATAAVERFLVGNGRQLIASVSGVQAGT